MPRFFGLLTRTTDSEWACEFPDLAGFSVCADTIARLRLRARAELQRAIAHRHLRREPEITASSADKIARHPGGHSALLLAVDVREVSPIDGAARSKSPEHVS